MGVNEQLPIPRLIVAVVQRAVPAEFLKTIVPVRVAAVLDVTVAVRVNAEPAVGSAGEIVGIETAELARTTDKVKVEVPEVPVTVAVCVYVFAVEVSVGVPEIVPFEFKVSPAGKDGLIEYEIPEPPVTVGIIDVIGTPKIPVVVEGEVVTRSGILILVAEAVSERPTELIAFTRKT